MKKKSVLLIIFMFFVLSYIFSETPDEAMNRLLKLFKSYNITSIPGKIGKNIYESRILSKVKRSNEEDTLNKLYKLDGDNYILTRSLNGEEEKSLINIFHKVNYKVLNEKQINENNKLKAGIESLFHFNTLVKNALRDHWDNMSSKQKNEFINKFRELTEVIAYPQASYFYHNSKNSFKKSYMQGNRAYIDSENYNIDKDLDITISYIFQEIDGQWVVVDVEMNDHSLVEAYRLQVNRIVKKSGLDGLMVLLSKKYEEYIN